MRNDMLVAGIILVIVGIVFYFIGTNMLEESPWHIFSSYSSYQSMRTTGNFMVMIGYIFGIVGVIVSIAGIASPDKREEMIEVIGEQKADQKDYKISDSESKGDIRLPKFCSQCGNKVEGSPMFCYKCGTKLR